MGAKDRPLVVVADDQDSILKTLEYAFEGWDCRVACAPDKEKLQRELAREEPCLLLLDLCFGEHDGIEVLRDVLRDHPGLSVVLLTGNGSIENAVTAIKFGAYDYLTKPPDLYRLRIILNHAVEKRRLNQRIHRLEQLLDPRQPLRTIWGESAAVRKLRDLIAAIAPTDATGLILGESGTGKELVARALHEQSGRRHGPFVPVNMAALPRELAESLLFGHEKGAFTGADREQLGCCETAGEGTLFLDEIGDMEFALQGKLLRFLQERTFQRVGSGHSRRADVRVVAATNQDLREGVRAGRFREDLYYRLNVVPIAVPTLRERREDITLLADRFLEWSTCRHGKGLCHFTDDARALLTAYHWPGNVRQLENLVERLVILARGPEIGAEALPEEIREPESVASLATSAPAAPPEHPDACRGMEQAEKEALVKALRRAGGKVGAAARLLGIGQATAYRKIKRYGINLDNHAYHSAL